MELKNLIDGSAGIALFVRRCHYWVFIDLEITTKNKIFSKKLGRPINFLCKLSDAENMKKLSDRDEGEKFRYRKNDL